MTTKENFRELLIENEDKLRKLWAYEHRQHFINLLFFGVFCLSFLLNNQPLLLNQTLRWPMIVTAAFYSVWSYYYNRKMKKLNDWLRQLKCPDCHKSLAHWFTEPGYTEGNNKIRFELLDKYTKCPFCQFPLDTEISIKDGNNCNSEHII